MFYTIYEVRNLINGKIYIGCHVTNDLNDGYMGSGKLIRNAIKKYGLENFSKQILFIFDNSEDMFLKEQSLVSKDFVSKDDNYNLNVGGQGGFQHINESGQNGNSKRSLLFKTDLEWKEKYAKRQSDIWKQKMESGYTSPSKGKKRSPETIEKMKLASLGRKHSRQTKRIIGLKNSVYQNGPGNSMYNRRWMYDPITGETKLINLENIRDYQLLGWKRGKKSTSRIKN